MDKSKSDFYVYQHRRPDTGDVFYVGIGKKKRSGSLYGRNSFWKRVVAKNQGIYSIEIIHENVSLEFAFSEELRLIKFYGRRDLGTGTLVNMCDGGAGNLNPSPEQRAKHSKAMSGRKLTQEHKDKVSAGLSGKYKGENSWMYGKKLPETTVAKMRARPSNMKGKKHTPESLVKMSQALKGRKSPKTTGELSWAWGVPNTPDMKATNQLKNSKWIVSQIDINTGEVVAEFLGANEAGRETGIDGACINKVINGHRNKTGGYKWTKRPNLNGTRIFRDPNYQIAS